MKLEDIQKHWNCTGVLGMSPHGVSLNPEDGETLAEAKIIQEVALPEAVKKARAESEKKLKSYKLFNLPVSFVPGLKKGHVYWIGEYHTIIGVTNEEGKLINA